MGSNISNPVNDSATDDEFSEVISSDYVSAQELIPANSGAISFEVKSSTGAAQLHLLTGHRRLVYTINLRKRSGINRYTRENKVIDIENYTTEDIELKEYQEFWVTWFNGEVCVGHGHSNVPFMKYSPQNRQSELIRYIIFDNGDNGTTTWKYQMPPNVFETRPTLPIKVGKLKWVPHVRNAFPRLPPDALIGGFENEPLYIMRGMQNGFLCPGTYVPSKHSGFIPWGAMNIASDFEVLCGYDAAWVPTSGKNIPTNAIVAGFSEGEEYRFIGRSVHDGHLINGNVSHLRNFIPYVDRVYVYNKFEVLVDPNVNP